MNRPLASIVDEYAPEHWTADEWNRAYAIAKDATREALILCAWWRDGKQYVGSGARTLVQALADVENIKPKDPQ